MFTVPAAHLKFSDPRTISGCQCWLRSDFGITQSGGTVSAWASQVGSVSGNATQSTGAKQPAYSTSGGLNSRPRITYAAGQGFEWALDLQGAMTVVMVYQLSAKPVAGAGEFGMHVVRGSTGPTFSVRDRLNALGGYFDRNWLFNYTAAGVNSVGVNLAVSLSAEVDIVTYNGGSISAIGSYTDDLNGVSETVAASSAFGLTGISLGSIGCYVDAAHAITASMIGDLYEVIVYNRAITAGEREILWNYLKELYGL